MLWEPASHLWLQDLGFAGHVRFQDPIRIHVRPPSRWPPVAISKLDGWPIYYHAWLRFGYVYIYIERERARVHLFCLGHATLPPVLTQRSAVHIAAHLGLKNAISTISFTCDQCDTTINLLILSVRSQTQTQRNYIFDNLPLGQVLALRSKLWPKMLAKEFLPQMGLQAHFIFRK